MSGILENFPLRELNTFGIDITCRYYTTLETKKDIISFFSNYPFINLPYLILGFGSNILFTRDFPGLIIRPNIKGIELIEQSGNNVWIRSGSIEEWDNLVKRCVEKGYGGIENLSLIPGSVGSAPIQNIGAYGVELKDCIDRVAAIDLKELKEKEFSVNECRFGYRESIFKREPGRYLITHVTLRLSRDPVFKTDYGPLQDELKQYPEISLTAIRDAVISIRRRKLPDPLKLGNAGSFFKNPVLEKKDIQKIRKKHPRIPVHPHSGTHDKVPAAWLIEQCGWKGKRVGNAGVYNVQPLVLVNHGNASGHEIFDLSEMIRRSVYDAFGIVLEREVMVV